MIPNTINEKNAGIENSHAVNRVECTRLCILQLASTIKNFSKTRSMVLEPNTNVVHLYRYIRRCFIVTYIVIMISKDEYLFINIIIKIV